MIRVSAKELAEDAALYASPGNEQEIASQMKIVFKDENLRAPG